MEHRLSFSCDYLEGAHPAILQRLCETNFAQTAGYGTDEYCESAREKIRAACGAPNAEIHFLVGGTQTNATVIDALLRSYEGVIAADTGHINCHEAGAIEFGGHKVLTLPQENGKITASQICALLDQYEDDANRDHTVMPGMVYLSQPTENGTLYSLSELDDLWQTCQDCGLFLYVDGARLGYGVMADGADLTLPEIAHLCDVFYIGGTKVGALFGEAVVIMNPALKKDFRFIMKQRGGRMAKGRLLGIQFDVLFTDDLYTRISRNAIETADRLKEGLAAKGYRFYMESPTNQVFVVLENTQLAALEGKAKFGFWEKFDDRHTVVRIATSWATKMEEIEQLIALM